jgi:hypothetical protein
MKCEFICFMNFMGTFLAIFIVVFVGLFQLAKRVRGTRLGVSC